MKVKVVFDISEADRRNINNYGGPGGRSAKASHAEVKAFIENHTNALLESLSLDDDVGDYE